MASVATQPVNAYNPSRILMQLHGPTLLLSPSDLVASAACPHLVQLEQARARGRMVVPEQADAQAHAIARRGDQHEAAYITPG